MRARPVSDGEPQSYARNLVGTPTPSTVSARIHLSEHGRLSS